jgi:hypothetical protein
MQGMYDGAREGDSDECYEVHEFHLCASCHQCELRPTRLRITRASGGQSCSVDDDALVCNAGGDELIGERAAAFLLTHRALAWYAEMAASGYP